MSYESIILIENVSTAGANIASEKKPGAGYHRKSDSLHTVVYSVNNLLGTVKLQGTLELYPVDADWFDITGTVLGNNQDVLTSVQVSTANFAGNFVWIRAVYTLQSGSITEIRYNH